MKGHQSRIKKLSTAMRHGLRMAQERGIKRVVGQLFRKNSRGEVCGACALGMAYIGRFGIEAAKQIDENADGKAYDALNKVFNINSQKSLTCLKKVGPKNIQKVEKFNTSQFVATLNDNNKLPVEVIAEKLEECKL